MTDKNSRQIPRREDEESTIVKNLQKRIEELEEMIKKQDSQAPTSNPDDLIDIRPDASIKVISVCPTTLCLTGRDKNNPFIFEEWGEVKRIRYEDVNAIIEHHRPFLKKGYFQILDQRVIKYHALEEIYEKILDIDTLEKIESGNFSDAIKILKTANEGQQQVVAERIVQKLISGTSTFSLDFLDKVSRIVGYNLKEKADNSIALLEIYRGKEDEQDKKLKK